MRQYLCTVDKSDIQEFFEYTQKHNSMSDLLKTIENPSIPEEFLAELSKDRILLESESYKKKKEDAFQKLYEKHDWKRLAPPDQFYIYEDGKVYILDFSKISVCNHCEDK